MNEVKKTEQDPKSKQQPQCGEHHQAGEDVQCTPPAEKKEGN